MIHRVGDESGHANTGRLIGRGNTFNVWNREGKRRVELKGNWTVRRTIKFLTCDARKSRQSSHPWRISAFTVRINRAVRSRTRTPNSFFDRSSLSSVTYHGTVVLPPKPLETGFLEKYLKDWRVSSSSGTDHNFRVILYISQCVYHCLISLGILRYWHRKLEKLNVVFI